MTSETEMQRLRLIEVATMRPDDIQRFYSQYMVKINGCSFLIKGAPSHVPLLFRGRLRHFNAQELPIVLAGKDPEAKRTCGNSKCINPEHVL